MRGPMGRERLTCNSILPAFTVNGRTEVVRALLMHGGSNVDARWGSWGLTALHQGA